MPILHWLNKEQAVTKAKQCSYRLLEEVPELSYGDKNNENLLIQGDNLEALKALMPFYAGKVKCIFIDPPYNTKSAFEHYDDNLEHSQWLSLMYPRLELLRELLSEEGSIWVTIDDNESHYLKVVCDEIFGRNCFCGNMVWQKKYAPQNDAAKITAVHDHILVYSKKRTWNPNLLPRTEVANARYTNRDGDERGPWKAGDLTSKTKAANHSYKIVSPKTGKEFYPVQGRQWAPSLNTFNKLLNDNRIWFGESGNNVPALKQFLSEVQQGTIPMTLWFREDVGDNQLAKREINKLELESVFETPKPESLIERILVISTNSEDIVLDSFLGSGTTAAVVHKMNRQYIGIELGEHAKTHCQPRLKKVIDGEQGGISKSVNWQGGGGFRFYKLGQTVFDEYGHLNPEITFPTLAAHIWYLETKTPLEKNKRSAFLGVHNETAYYLLYNGILGDRRPNSGNVLTHKLLQNLPKITEHKNRKIVIYGESTRLGEARLQQANITFKQIPYDVGQL